MWHEIATWQEQLNLRPDLSAKTIALYHPRWLSKRFPELCRAISAKHLASPFFTRQLQVITEVTNSIVTKQQYRKFDSKKKFGRL